MTHESLDLRQGLEGDVDEKAMGEDRKNMDEDEDGEGLDDDEDDEDYNDCVEYTGDSLLVIGEEEEGSGMVKEEGIDDEEEEEGEVEKNEKGEPEKKETKLNKNRSKNDNDMM